ncbi:MAG: DUF2845 domain-containing protein [Deltaproteobacteria bacterium]|nr:DUF2845 domain-containing protein [Deltaproteobacteria bacterium]
MRLYMLAVLFGPFVLGIGAVNAQSPINMDIVQCGLHQVRVGVTKLEVLDRCGEPQLKENVSGENQPNIQQWLYKPERNMTRIFTFEGTVLRRIQLVPTSG